MIIIFFPNDVPILMFYVLSFYVLQVLVKYSCGSSYWSCYQTVAMQQPLPGRAQMENSKWWTPMRCQNDGVRGRASLIWTMTRWAELSDITMTKTLWRKSMARDMHTSLTLLAWLRPCNPLQLTQQHTSINKIYWWAVTIILLNSTSWQHMHQCPRLHLGSFLRLVPIGQHLALISTPTYRITPCPTTLVTCPHI